MADLRPQLRAMPSSVNDACRTMEAAADQIDELVNALHCMVENHGGLGVSPDVVRAKAVLAAVVGGSPK